MQTHPAWRGVRMRRTMAGGPDKPSRPVTVPAAWEQSAADALAELAPGSGPVHVAEAAAAWIMPIAAKAEASGPALRAVLGEGLAEHCLHTAMVTRRLAPEAAIWAGDADRAAPRCVLNLAAFADDDGADWQALAACAALAATTAALSSPEAARLRIGFADLAGLIARLGLDYDSDAARAVAADAAAVIRARAEAVSAALAADGPAAGFVEDWPEAAGLARAGLTRLPAGTRLRHAGVTAVAAPDAAEALLGVETGGFAPAFAPLSAEGRLTGAARASLAARGLSPETALAMLYAGEDPLPSPTIDARAAMRAAVAPFVQELPAERPLAVETKASAHATRRDLPARHAGTTQRATLGGQRLFLRTGEYADGQLGEIALALPKDSPQARALMEALGNAVSIGLQHGVPLDAFVEAWLGTRFGAAGAVEGDPHVVEASSPLDYAARHLASHYLRDATLPAVERDAPPPLLPLDLPETTPAPRRLRLVSSRRAS